MGQAELRVSSREPMRRAMENPWVWKGQWGGGGKDDVSAVTALGKCLETSHTNHPLTVTLQRS